MAYNKSFTYILMHINPNYISKYEKKTKPTYDDMSSNIVSVPNINKYVSIPRGIPLCRHHLCHCDITSI